MTRWCDEEVVAWAEKFAHEKQSLMAMKKELKVSHSTIWWCFKHRLASQDMNLYNKVLENLAHNKKKKGDK